MATSIVRWKIRHHLLTSWLLLLVVLFETLTFCPASSQSQQTFGQHILSSRNNNVNGLVLRPFGGHPLKPCCPDEILNTIRGGGGEGTGGGGEVTRGGGEVHGAAEVATSAQEEKNGRYKSRRKQKRKIKSVHGSGSNISKNHNSRSDGDGAGDGVGNKKIKRRRRRSSSHSHVAQKKKKSIHKHPKTTKQLEVTSNGEGSSKRKRKKNKTRRESAPAPASASASASIDDLKTVSVATTSTSQRVKRKKAKKRREVHKDHGDAMQHLQETNSEPDGNRITSKYDMDGKDQAKQQDQQQQQQEEEKDAYLSSGQENKPRKKRKKAAKRPKASSSSSSSSMKEEQYPQEDYLAIKKEMEHVHDEQQQQPPMDTAIKSQNDDGITVKRTRTKKKRKKTTKSKVPHFSTKSKIHESVGDDRDRGVDVGVEIQVDVAWSGQEKDETVQELDDLDANSLDEVVSAVVPSNNVESNKTKHGTRKRRKKKIKKKTNVEKSNVTHKSDLDMTNVDEVREDSDLNHGEDEGNMIQTVDDTKEMMGGDIKMEDPTVQTLNEERNDDDAEEGDEGLKSEQESIPPFAQVQDEMVDSVQVHMNTNVARGMDRNDITEDDTDEEEMNPVEANEVSTKEEIPMQTSSHDAIVGDDDNADNESEEEHREHGEVSTVDASDEEESIRVPSHASVVGDNSADSESEEEDQAQEAVSTMDGIEEGTTMQQIPSHNAIIGDDDDNADNEAEEEEQAQETVSTMDGIEEGTTMQQIPSHNAIIGDDDSNADNESEEEEQAQETVSTMDGIEEGTTDEESVVSLVVDENSITLEDDNPIPPNDKAPGHKESVNVIDEGILVLEDAAKIIEMEKGETAMGKILGKSFEDLNNNNILEEGTEAMLGTIDAERSVSFDMINDNAVVIKDVAEMPQRDQNDNVLGANIGGLVLEDAAQIIRAELENEKINTTDEAAPTVGESEGIKTDAEEDEKVIPEEPAIEEDDEVEQSVQAQSSNSTAEGGMDEESEGLSEDENGQEEMIADLSTIDETASNSEIQETSFAISDGEHQEDEVSVVVDDTERSADDNVINSNNEDSEGRDSVDDDSDDDEDYGDSNIKTTTSSQQILDEQSSNDVDVASTPIESKTSNSVPFEASTETDTSNFSIDDADKESEEILVTPRNVAVDTDSRPDSSEITCSVVTWNLAELSPTESDAAFIKSFREVGGSGSDFVLFGGQETENTKPRRTEGSRSRELRRILIKMLGKNYVPLALHSLGGVQFALFCKNTIIDELEHVSIADVACGIGNVFHNKGAIGAFVQMKARNTGTGGKDAINRKKSVKMLFVACHLAAHVKKVDARNADYWRIVSELEAQAPPSFLKRRQISSHQHQTQLNGGEHLLDSVDHVIFCGDLNYRIDLPREFTIRSLKELTSTPNSQEAKSVRMSLLRHDQLLRTISEGRAFIGMSEGEITFPPTFKFDKGTHAYDTQKQRVPAWTDRILFRPKGVRVREYRSVQDAMHSDHRPVYATLGLSMIGRELTSHTNVQKRRKRGKGQRVGL